MRTLPFVGLHIGLMLGFLNPAAAQSSKSSVPGAQSENSISTGKTEPGEHADELVTAVNCRTQFAVSGNKKLYQAENIRTVEMETYIPELVGYIHEMIGQNSKLAFEYDITDINLDVAHAVPVGLIINESVTNAIKYAFPGTRTGRNVIRITMERKESNRIQIVIADNGIGIPADLLNGGGPGFGLRLLFGLTDDLDGNLVIHNENGTKIILEFAQYTGL